MIYIFEKDDFQKGIEFLNLAAAQNFSGSHLIFGIIYYNGFYTKFDINKAIQHLTYAANDGFEYAEYLIGIICIEGKYVKKDLPKGFNLLLRSSSKGFYLSFSSIGSLYHKGYYVCQNILVAIQFYNNGSNLYDPYSKNNLAIIYRYGFKDIVGKNIHSSIEYLREAIKRKEEFITEYNLAHIYLYEKISDDSIDEALKLLLNSELQFSYSSFLLCFALIIKYKFKISDIEKELTNIGYKNKNKIIRMIRSHNLISENAFNLMFEKYRHIDFIFDHMKQPIITNEFYEVKTEPHRKNITKDFRDGLGDF